MYVITAIVYWSTTNLLFFYIFFKLTNSAMDKWRMVIWCNGEIKNRTGHFLSIKCWICLFVLFLNTKNLLISRNKQTLIRYCNTSIFVVIFRNGKTEKLCKYFINYCHIVAVGVSSFLSLLASRIWRLVVEVLVFSVLSLSLFCGCWQGCHFLWMRPSASVPRYWRHLVVIVVGSVNPIKNNISFCS